METYDETPIRHGWSRIHRVRMTMRSMCDELEAVENDLADLTLIAEQAREVWKTRGRSYAYYLSSVDREKLSVLGKMLKKRDQSKQRDVERKEGGHYG